MRPGRNLVAFGPGHKLQDERSRFAGFPFGQRFADRAQSGKVAGGDQAQQTQAVFRVELRVCERCSPTSPGEARKTG